MSYCPSHDWDRYINEQDDAMQAEVNFYISHRAEILQVACAMLAGGRDPMAKDLFHDAAEIVSELSNRCGEGM